jgi:hypothetical protein
MMMAAVVDMSEGESEEVETAAGALIAERKGISAANARTPLEEAEAEAGEVADVRVEAVGAAAAVAAAAAAAAAGAEGRIAPTIPINLLRGTHQHRKIDSWRIARVP